MRRLGKPSRAGQLSEHDHSRHPRSAHACKPWHLPKKNYGFVENIPPGDWCIQVGAGQTLEVNAASGQVEVATETPMRLDAHYRNEIVRTATIGKGRCADLGHQKYNLLTYTPVGAGGTIRVRVGRLPDSIVKC